ncbi:UvrD-helicase domain-containing protein [Micromonospora sp. DT48]|uniref:UvrD-helicase domain-containing protein n=1 Tax=Micromonospora sp. DT48 TaxID=3393429 RepID=UPI003CF227C8
MLIPAADWRPSGIDDLEPAAWRALYHEGNTAVVAGPGAGKSEFLAQKAAYLLQTGSCPWPQRILAISFKRDAAANLRRRVAARVPEHADRFVSMTFDAFTKGLVDRFASALPDSWRMPHGYEISYASERQVEAFLGDIVPAAPPLIRLQVAQLHASRFIADTVGSWDLPVTAPDADPDDAAAYAALQWWRLRYFGRGPARVDFVMLNRLAELLVRCVPKLRRALCMTYPYVFVDEFQDTTSAQFLVPRLGVRRRSHGHCGRRQQTAHHGLGRRATQGPRAVRRSVRRDHSPADVELPFHQSPGRRTARHRHQTRPQDGTGDVEGRQRHRRQPRRGVDLFQPRPGDRRHRGLDRR